jgi:thioester reductase-like protein
VKKFFLTGATGVVGSSILKTLLSTTSAPIALLIRGPEPQLRLNNILKFLNVDFHRANARVEIINSAVEERNFGLSAQEFGQFASELSSIFHCAANVDLMQAPNKARAMEEACMQNLLQVLTQNRDCQLEHVSTVGVKGKSIEALRAVPVKEDRTYFNSYEFSKHAGEKALYPLIDQGFRINIHRPSMVVGEESTGRILHFQIFYFLIRLISGDLTVGLLPPIFDHKLDTIPCDFVAQRIVDVSQSTGLRGQIFHYCSGPETSLTLGEIGLLIKKAKSELGLSQRTTYTIPTGFFRIIGQAGTHLPLGSKWKKRVELLPQLLDYTSQQQNFLNQETKEHFKASWPNPKDYLLQSLIYYFQTVRQK